MKRELVLLAVLAACGDGAGQTDSATAVRSDSVAAVPTRVAASPGACVLAPLWSPCLLRKALENAGLAPQEEDSVHYPFLATAGRRWRLGRAELQTFMYPTAEALRADLAKLDTITGQPRSGGDRVEWSRPPATIVSRNLLVFLLGGNERQDERIRNAIEAGVLAIKPR